MLNIKDRVFSYNRSEATLHMDYRIIPTKDDRLFGMREKFIKSIYQLLKSEEFKDFYIKYGEQMDVNINIKHDTIEVNY